MPVLNPTQNGIWRGSERDLVAAAVSRSRRGSSGRRTDAFNSPSVEGVEVAGVPTILGFPRATAEIEVDRDRCPNLKALEKLQLLVGGLELHELGILSASSHLDNKFLDAELLTDGPHLADGVDRAACGVVF